MKTHKNYQKSGDIKLYIIVKTQDCMRIRIATYFYIHNKNLKVRFWVVTIGI